MGLCITKQNALVYKEKVRQYWRASTWDIILGIKIGHSEINGKNSLRNILLMRINQKFEITLPHMPTFFFKIHNKQNLHISTRKEHRDFCPTRNDRKNVLSKIIFTEKRTILQIIFHKTGFVK